MSLTSILLPEKKKKKAVVDEGLDDIFKSSVSVYLCSFSSLN